jgi:DedD protein
MERKKLLLVAVSVGIFLVIIISASILIFTPKTGTAYASGRPITAGRTGTLPSEQARPRPVPAEPAETAKPAEGNRGVQGPTTVSATQETNFYINGERPDASYTVEKGEGDVTAKVTINIPKPSTAAVPDVPAPPPKAAPAPAPSRPAVAAAPAAKPAAPKAAPAKPASAARPAPSKARNDYWVQTGAFSTQVRAEGVKETLAAKGITSIIENRVVDGKTWYRVRVGPYTSETEANYWLALVKSIDGFADSQVRQTPAAR